MLNVIDGVLPFQFAEAVARGEAGPYVHVIVLSGCLTTAVWVSPLGAERVKRMLFTGDKTTGCDAEETGLIFNAVLDEEVDDLAHPMASVPVNQLAMQKLLINQAIEATDFINMPGLSTLFDGISRHSPEGMALKKRVEQVGWKQAVSECDTGTYDWTKNSPLGSME